MRRVRTTRRPQQYGAIEAIHIAKTMQLWHLAAHCLEDNASHRSVLIRLQSVVFPEGQEAFQEVMDAAIDALAVSCDASTLFLEAARTSPIVHTFTTALVKGSSPRGSKSYADITCL